MRSASLACCVRWQTPPKCGGSSRVSIAEMLEPDLKEGAGGLRDVQSFEWAGWALGPPGATDDARSLAATCRTPTSNASAPGASCCSTCASRCNASPGRVPTGSRCRSKTRSRLALGARRRRRARPRPSRASREIAWIAADVWSRVRDGLAVPADAPRHADRVARRRRGAPRRSRSRGSRSGWRGACAARARSRVGSGRARRAVRPHVADAAAGDAATDLGRLATRRVPAAAARRRTRPFRCSRRSTTKACSRCCCPNGSTCVRCRSATHITASPSTGTCSRRSPNARCCSTRATRPNVAHDDIDAVVARACRRPELLLLGALLHDIAKGMPGDHSEVGAATAEAVARRIGLDSEGREILVVARAKPPAHGRGRDPARPFRRRPSPTTSRPSVRRRRRAPALAVPAHDRRFARDRTRGVESVEGRAGARPLRQGGGRDRARCAATRLPPIAATRSPSGSAPSARARSSTGCPRRTSSRSTSTRWRRTPIGLRHDDGLTVHCVRRERTGRRHRHRARPPADCSRRSRARRRSRGSTCSRPTSSAPTDGLALDVFRTADPFGRVGDGDTGSRATIERALVGRARPRARGRRAAAGVQLEHENRGSGRRRHRDRSGRDRHGRRGARRRRRRLAVPAGVGVCRSRTRRAGGEGGDARLARRRRLLRARRRGRQDHAITASVEELRAAHARLPR